MYRLWVLAAMLAVAGCQVPHLTLKPDACAANQAVYGSVPIIRPGMSEAEVDSLVGPGKAGFPLGSFAFMSWSYCDGLQVETDFRKVLSCRCGEFTIHGPDPNPSLIDAYLELKLIARMTPAEIAGAIGRPKYGVETPGGNVCLFYPQPGIEVEFKDGGLIRWRRMVTYKDGPPKQSD